jgi:hypothetical protein
MSWRRQASRTRARQTKRLKDYLVRRISPIQVRWVLGEVVTKCWKAEYKNIGEAGEDIMRIQKKFASEGVVG